MPVLFIEGPSGPGSDAKKKLIKKSIDALVGAYQMPDDRVFIREYSSENVGHTGHSEQPGEVESGPAMPVAFIEAPPGLPIDARRTMMKGITAAIADAYQISDLRDILVFLREYPIENVATNGLLQTENPEFSSPGTGR